MQKKVNLFSAILIFISLILFVFPAHFLGIVFAICKSSFIAGVEIFEKFGQK